MTRGPMVTRDTTSATEALQLMVQRGFRHLVSSAATARASETMADSFCNASPSAMRMGM
jgi:hypothetical protein